MKQNKTPYLTKFAKAQATSSEPDPESLVPEYAYPSNYKGRRDLKWKDITVSPDSDWDYDHNTADGEDAHKVGMKYLFPFSELTPNQMNEQKKINQWRNIKRQAALNDKHYKALQDRPAKELINRKRWAIWLGTAENLRSLPR